MKNNFPRFCIEETSFIFNDTDFKNIASFIKIFIEIIMKIKDDNHQITRWSKFEFINILPDITVTELMYNPRKSPLEHDLRILFMKLINQCQHWDDNYSIKTKNVFIGQQLINGESIGYVFEQVISNRGVSCLCLKRIDQLADVIETNSGTERALLHFIFSLNSIIIFYRNIIEIENFSEEEYINHGKLAFPNLFFCFGIHKQFRRFRQDYRSIRSVITYHLATINDNFHQICKEKSFEPEKVCKTFGSCWNIDMSLESPNTKNNRKAMKEREVIINNELVVCEWHTKLTPTYDRIHFHPGKMNIADGKIIIGIFAEHLST